MPETTCTPARILDFSWGLARTATLVAALELDLFTAIAQGARTADALARLTGAHPRGVEALLTALTAAELVHHVPPDTYQLAEDTATYLVRGRPAYLGDLRHVHRELNFRLWPQLTEAVRNGAPQEEIFAGRAEEIWAHITPYLDALGAGAGRWIAAEVADLVPPSPRSLDVGCGYGGYGRALVDRWGGSVVGLDREESAVAAGHRAEQAGLADRATYRAGDLRSMPWGADFDVVLLSNLLHGYDPAQARELVARAAAALADDGILLVYEIVPDDAGTDLVGAFFSLEMLLTSDGAAHSLGDYHRWLVEAGLSPVRDRRSPTGPGTLIVATPRS